jgi:hypothetical protein
MFYDENICHNLFDTSASMLPATHSTCDEINRHISVIKLSRGNGPMIQSMPFLGLIYDDLERH